MRNVRTLLLALLFAFSANAESFSGSIGFGATPDFQGVLQFTALAPGESSSSFGAFTGYTQTPSIGYYTYLYYLHNQSNVGTPTSFCNEHCFYGLDLDTLLDPTGPDIGLIGSDTSNGGEAPSAAYGTSPDLISYEFDLAPNYGIRPDGTLVAGGVPGGGFSAFLRFYSPFGPSDLGGAWITNNTGDVGNDFIHITSGVTTPVPEPASAALLALGLLALAVRRRR
jgi:hypothetical protein